MQRALVQYNKRENYLLVHEALTKAYRDDLIGTGKKALIPAKVKKSESQSPQAKKTNKTRPAKPAQAKQSKINQKDKSRGKNGKKINRIH